jgi:hypothetical protein
MAFFAFLAAQKPLPFTSELVDHSTLQKQDPEESPLKLPQEVSLYQYLSSYLLECE